MQQWTELRKFGFEMVGIIPLFLLDSDPRPAKEQFDERYSFGGGWRPMSGWTLSGNRIKYPGDPPYSPVAGCIFRTETIYVYPHAWVAIVQSDGSFEVSRMD